MAGDEKGTHDRPSWDDWWLEPRRKKNQKRIVVHLTSITKLQYYYESQIFYSH